VLDAVQEIFGRGYQDGELGRAVSAFECCGKRLDGISGDPDRVRVLILRWIGGAVEQVHQPGQDGTAAAVEVSAGRVRGSGAPGRACCPGFGEIPAFGRAEAEFFGDRALQVNRPASD